MRGEAWKTGVRMNCNRSFTNTYIKVKKTPPLQHSDYPADKCSDEGAWREGHAQGKSLLESPPEQFQL